MPDREPARRDAMLNGALIALGALALVDTVVVHWIIGLHRTFYGPAWAVLTVEIATVALGVVLVSAGIWREGRSRPAK